MLKLRWPGFLRATCSQVRGWNLCYYGPPGSLEPVSLQTVHNARLWRNLLLGLCGLVFFFALHSKTALYNGSAPVKVTTATASKLWLDGQKMQIRSVDSGSGALIWTAFFCLYGLNPHRDPVVQSVFLTEPAGARAIHYLRLFFRPPPLEA